MLLVQFRGVGDVVLVTPALDALRERWPGARLHLWTRPEMLPLFAGDDRVAALWTRPASSLRFPGMWRRLRAEGFDLVLDFQSLTVTAVAAALSGGYGVGFRKRLRGRLYHRAVALEEHAGTDYAADHKLDLLRALGLPAPLRPPRLHRPATPHPVWHRLEEGPRIAFAPVSRVPYKRWNPVKAAETARRLHAATGACFVLVGGPGETDQITEVDPHLGDVPRRIVVARDLAEMVQLFAGADLYLGNDSGPRHAAAALGLPTVAWFGPQNPSHWTLPHDPRHPVIWDRERAAGRPVREDLRILPEDPERVAEVAAALLREAPRETVG